MSSTSLLPFSQMRVQDHLSNIRCIRQQHHQPVHSHTEAAIRRHTIAHRPQVILVHRVAFFVVSSVIATHFQEARFLVERVVQFCKSVAQLHPSYKSLETFHDLRVAGFALRQGGDIAGVIVDKGRLDQARLQIVTQQRLDQLAARIPGVGF